MKIIYSIAFLLALGGTALAQPQQDLEKYKNLYPGENGVFLENNENVTIGMKDGKPDISDYSEEEILLLNENAHYYDERNVYFSTFNELTSLHAKTLVIDKNNKYKEVPPSEISTKTSEEESIFYDDSKQKHILFAGLEPGSRLMLDYTIHVKNEYLLPIFYFNSYLPALSSVYTVSFPSSMALDYMLMNDNGKIEFSQTTKGNTTTYTWTLKNAAKYKHDDDAPNGRYYLPHILIRIAHYTAKGKNIRVLDDTTDLYNWFYHFVSTTNLTTSPAVQQVADSLKKISNGELDLVKHVFYWVENHIKYIAFENGLEGFIPRQGSLVCDRRYGDCKDMASVINSLLKACG